MRSETYSYRTGGRDTVLDITRDCSKFAADEADGLLHVFVPHATAGIAILETGAGSDRTCSPSSRTSCRRTTGGGTGTAPAATVGPM
jgi:hypothetical protein